MANTLLPLPGLFYLLHKSYEISYFLTLPLCIITGGLLVRLFIIQHDCGHGSYFKSQKANHAVGYFCSIFSMVPYFYWRKQHALHHATTGNLDKRGHGDMTTLTVKEYLAMSKIDRFKYRIYRNPFMFLLFGPILLVFLYNRVVRDKKHTTRGERWNVHISNLIFAALFGTIGWWIGWRELLAIGLPTLWVTAATGIWLFYVQHQFDPTYWKRQSEWSLQEAALEGSSYFKLPAVLRWFTGNIGYHHIHHLHIRIPNYRLKEVHDTTPEFQDVHTLTIRSSLKTMFLSLWDEDREELVRFRDVQTRSS